MSERDRCVTTHNRMRLLSLASACALSAVSCSGVEHSSPLPSKPAVVDVRMEDYRFVFDPAIAPGRTIFRVVNTGHLDHNLVMFPAPEDYPPIEEQLHGDERRSVPPFAQIFPRRPGESGSFAVDLLPDQRYVFLCLMGGGANEVSHALKGMASEFVATVPHPAARRS